ncbi:helix-turn-helix domain-containing protein [Solibacillus sp. FSL H8-0538]|uniref:helix-turn-helix domain-containing protein n=1 Tax=Solibacillus sp. FSL H8-0538 TaxID=2921400 RepID=UPI0030F892B0
MFLLTELGARLKEARLAKGYSLDDLQEITKIQKRYLVGIEEGNYSIMPGSFYVRAFIKQYAEAVGLEPDALLAEYQKDVPGAQKEEVAQSFTQSPNRRKMNSTSSSKMMEVMPKFIVALFIIVIIVVIWALYLQKANNSPDIIDDASAPIEYAQKPTTNEQVPSVDEDKEEDIVEEPIVEEPVVEQTISAGVIDGETTTYEVTGTETLSIRVEVAGETWVGIRNEARAEQIEAKVYSTGTVVENDSTADGYARIRLGNSKVAKVFVNDVELQYTQDLAAQNIILKLVKEEQ